MLNQKPRVSIIIPTYNRQQFICEAIRSVLDQTVSDWELIIVDDGSTDNTAEVIQPYLLYENIHYYKEWDTPFGVSHARNFGVNKAQGELVGFLDSDDLYYPDTIEILLKQINGTPQYMVYQAFYTVVDEKNERVLRNNGIDLVVLPDGSYALPPNVCYSWQNILDKNICLSLTTALFRRQVFSIVGLLDEKLKFFEDYDFLVRIYDHFPEGIIMVPEYVLRYRCQTNSISRSSSQFNEMINCNLKILDWIFSESSIANKYKIQKSIYYASSFRMLARLQLNNHTPSYSRRIAHKAWQFPLITPMIWIKYLGPLYFQSFFPPSFYEWLANMNRRIRLIRFSQKILDYPVTITGEI